MTRRFDQMLEWYQMVFEAKLVYKNPAIAFLTYDDEHHRLALATRRRRGSCGAAPPIGEPLVMDFGLAMDVADDSHLRIYPS